MNKRFSSTLLPALALILCIALAVSAQSQSGNSNSGKLTIASCQFPVSADIQSNLNWITKQMTEAKLRKATVVHFPECALSGYPGTDMSSLDNFNWKQLRQATDSVSSLAKKLEVWVILGSIHRLSGNNKPFNSLYVITPEGKILDRYDKRFCTSGDLEHFTPGDHFVNFDINGIKCGLLICYDVRFPELYRGYSATNTQLIFQSFYNARSGPETIHPIIMPVTAQASAASNYFYMSLTNSCVAESWPCHFITPDGLVQNKLERNVPGILISVVDTSVKFYDASGQFRPDAMKGKLNSGKTLTDPLADRKSLSY